ncbi:MAG: trehalose-phosphatase [Xanthomonadaceae bacterium]|jgi:trehalose 6-phosphate phosphatase|nr:trehalose-phosphatase [Xanthomonadaceae bacterium]
MMDAIPSRFPRPPSFDTAYALFLDVDGTLIDFARYPSQARLRSEVRDTITKLSERLDGALALVSGRPLGQLDELFAPLHLPAAGLHGHQIRHPHDYRNDIPGDTSSWLHALHRDAMTLAATHPGVLVEDKGISLALHWRNSPSAGPDITRFAESRIETMPGYRLQPGDHVIEFLPEGNDKGCALETLLQYPPFTGRKPIFVGDDLTDEFGFAAADRFGGWGVLVGNRASSAAHYALPDTRAVHAWLQANTA